MYHFHRLCLFLLLVIIAWVQANKEYILLVGPSGFGKTTFANYLLSGHAEEPFRVSDSGVNLDDEIQCRTFKGAQLCDTPGVMPSYQRIVDFVNKHKKSKFAVFLILKSGYVWRSEKNAIKSLAATFGGLEMPIINVQMPICRPDSIYENAMCRFKSDHLQDLGFHNRTKVWGFNTNVFCSHVPTEYDIGSPKGLKNARNIIGNGKRRLITETLCYQAVKDDPSLKKPEQSPKSDSKVSKKDLKNHSKEEPSPNPVSSAATASSAQILIGTLLLISFWVEC